MILYHYATLLALCLPAPFIVIRKVRHSKFLHQAAKKALTEKWLSSESPTLMMWMDIKIGIYRMERLTAVVNLKN